MDVDDVRQEIDAKVGFSADIRQWDYDAVRDYVLALVSVDDLFDVVEILDESEVLSDKQIASIDSLVETCISKMRR
jgi:hypothetical protein